MGMSDFNRLNSHMGMSPDSIKPVDIDRQVDDTLRRWPTLAKAYEAISASRAAQHQPSQEQTASGLDSCDAFEVRDLPVS